MFLEFERNLDKYADVIVRVGLNLQPAQRLLIIGVPLEFTERPLNWLHWYG